MLRKGAPHGSVSFGPFIFKYFQNDLLCSMIRQVYILTIPKVVQSASYMVLSQLNTHVLIMLM